MPTTWQRDFFRDVALDSWRAAFPLLPTRAETDFLARTFGARAGAHLLDLACGNGRHALELAVRGFHVTGVDLSEEFIREGESAGAAGVRFIRADMLELPADLEGAPFDGAYCFGNSVCYFDRGDLSRFLERVASALKPGAAFAIDTGAVAESILPSLPKGRWMRLPQGGRDDLFMLSEHRYHALEGRLDIEYTFLRGGTAVTRPASMFVFTLAEIRHLLRMSGFGTEDAFSSPEGEPYAAGSPRLLLVARRL